MLQIVIRELEIRSMYTPMGELESENSAWQAEAVLCAPKKPVEQISALHGAGRMRQHFDTHNSPI